MDAEINWACGGDADEILAVYTPYVLNTPISFETEPPPADEFRRRVEGIAAHYPYLVCKIGKKIIGYAYASNYRSRPAYQWDAELSIYISDAYRRMGIGKALYGALLPLLRRQGILNAYAAITVPDTGSVAFHQGQGFVTVGEFHHTGYKLGRWWDVLWMEKALDDYTNPPRELLPVCSLRDEAAQTIFITQAAGIGKLGL